MNYGENRKRRNADRNGANRSENCAETEKDSAASRARDYRPAKSEQRRQKKHFRPGFTLKIDEMTGESFRDKFADKSAG